MTKGITAYGMKLIPRKEGIWGQSGFLLFAAICESNGLNQFIKHVMCCQNSGSQVIELTSDAVDFEAIQAIATIATWTLDQFCLDGETGWKARNLH